jgi:RNA polymerase sigma-70 factor, ECF subfamily
MSKQEDFELIKSFVSRKDKMAFDTLVIKYKDMVFNLSYHFLNNVEDAEDCAQETFIKIYKALSKFKFQSAFSTWLYRITVNTCKNKMQSKNYKMKKKLVSDENMLYLNQSSSDHSENPEKKLEMKENIQILRKLIEKLPAKQKTLIILRDIENKSYEEIVEITGMKLGTIKSTLFRTREALKIQLQGEIHEL